MLRSARLVGLVSLLGASWSGACGGDSETASTGTGASSAETANASAGVGGAGMGTGGATTGAGGEPPVYDPKPPGPIGETPLTTEKGLVRAHALVPFDIANDLKVPAVIDAFVGEGYGDTKAAPGAPVLQKTKDGAAPPAPGASPKLITRFVHLADTQLADDESPTRLLFADAPGLTSAAFRPQDAHQCRILNAVVRTINGVHAATPIDFVVLGGDNADSAQENEVDWFQAILDGAARVECDSGADDDPVPGADNDPKDPFVAEGLKVPWKWVNGNHDVLVQGNFKVDAQRLKALGTTASTGTRDWSKPGGPMTEGEVPADPRRNPMGRAELLERVSKSQDGHGIDAAVKSFGKAFYTFDAGASVRFVVLDTACETGSSNGVLRKGDVESFVVPALDAAKADGKLVIVTSHHSSRKLGDGSGLGGTKQPDAITADELRDVLGSYDNLLVHLAGHSHDHYLGVVKRPGKTPYWEVETSAITDFPHQFKMFEVWDQDDGWVTLKGIAVDYSEQGDPLVVDGRKRAMVDYVTGNSSGDETLGARNVELWVKKPE